MLHTFQMLVYHVHREHRRIISGLDRRVIVYMVKIVHTNQLLLVYSVCVEMEDYFAAHFKCIACVRSTVLLIFHGRQGSHMLHRCMNI